MISFPPCYDPKSVEDDIYQMWESSGYFNPDTILDIRYSISEEEHRKSFSIVLPPPNVTGTLHLGHATMLAIEDILIRYHRMKGNDTVWIPGTDHAAIATQNVVEKKLWSEEKKTRHDLGREQFLKKVEDFVQQSKDTIHRQMRKMGASLDWSREAYTLDAPREQAVRTVFTMMYDDGLIYRGNRIVNWCTRCRSTLADDEVNYKEEKTKFYYLRYGPVVIGTARPETKFLDKVIIVHPKDKRYKKLVGTSFDVEWIEGKVKATVVADEIADREMGSGAMTITPAHSFADFALAQKYGFEIHQIINEHGKLTQAAGSMAGMSVKEAREKVVEVLQKKGLVERIDENYVHNLSVCYRCDTPVEPLVSKQWFIDVSRKIKVVSRKMQQIVGTKEASLKEIAVAVVKNGNIEIIPERFEKVYFHWMNNLLDWCISRQIWFGHRIPVWYCRSCSDRHPEPRIKYGAGFVSGSRIKSGMTDGIIVSIEPPVACPTCGSTTLEQDPDTLDTWFSSGLWTFSTLGWPDIGRHPGEAMPRPGSEFWRRHGLPRMTGDDLRRFHPTSVLETGYDILFFWVARMILMTTYALGEVPFHTVYLHGLVRDEQGRKMSKSLGNAMDPLISSEKYGTDAVRLSLVVGTTPGNDVNLSEKKIEGYRNFVNKLWNIARYCNSATEEPVDASLRGRSEVMPTADLPKGDNPETIVDRHSRHGLLRDDDLTLADRWIVSRMQRVIQSVTKDLEGYRLSRAAETLRAFTWDELADWYVEVSKGQLLSVISHQSTQQILSYLFENLLRLWHPFTPFVTEAIWSRLDRHRHSGEQMATPESDSGQARMTGRLLMIQEWSVANKNLLNPKAEKEFAMVQDVITAIRALRNAYQVDPQKMLMATVVSKKWVSVLGENKELIERLAKVSLEFSAKRKMGFLSAHPKTPGILIVVDSGAVDIAAQTKRLEKIFTELQQHITSLKNALSNNDFVKNAPNNVVAARKEMLATQQSKAMEIEKELEELNRLSK